MYTTYIAHPETLHFTSPQEQQSFVHQELSRLIYCRFTPHLHRSLFDDRSYTLSDLGIEAEFCVLLGFLIENHFHIQLPAVLNSTLTLHEIETTISQLFVR